jgi:hypothetical protein
MPGIGPGIEGLSESGQLNGIQKDRTGHAAQPGLYP